MRRGSELSGAKQGSTVAAGMNAKMNHQQSVGSILDSVLDGSVHVGNKDRSQQPSLTQLDPLQPDFNAQLPQEMQEELELLRKAVDDLKWKLDYEKGVNKEVKDLLEKKAANYLVQINSY